MIKEVFETEIKKHISSIILGDLPEWFGIEEQTNAYIENSQSMPFFAVYNETNPLGFIALKETSKYTAEIYCMGVLKKHQRKGYGRSLIKVFENYAKQKGYRLIQVKTVEEGKYDSYDITNRFYRSCGFIELEVFPTLWDKHNPCQVFVKCLC